MQSLGSQTSGVTGPSNSSVSVHGVRAETDAYAPSIV